jgi:hypothetical protein
MPGVMTPGDWVAIDSAKLLDTVYAVPMDLTGLRALDLGTLDGVHAFELERRGASVTALDIQSTDVTAIPRAITTRYSDTGMFGVPVTLDISQALSFPRTIAPRFAVDRNASGEPAIRYERDDDAGLEAARRNDGRERQEFA